MNGFHSRSETERLVIRPLAKEDYSNWLHAFEARHPSKSKYDQGKRDMSECTEEWFYRLVDRHQELALDDKAYIYGVFRKDDGVHIGMIDFSTLARDEFQWGRIGYSVHNQHWGKGYGKEAVSEALLLAFSDLSFHRIEAHINLDNEPSIRLAEIAGMQLECTRKAFLYEHGEWTDHLVYCRNAPF
ncbi:N-acetyltransferase [Paenibacillus sp. 1011MAR3C5]|uniref:GNAT family N-acetyltransferase n=1 Tax=Paenibacillus sp. 1011MAR3C5 TaxID=1675787 RepID=UPI000E6C90D8|nr:GNAT family protein [Paenibacillus sp. 1011MAR3C5]RJE87521.1 N-acetyltransferase [Paenibacillus sp. 1011MAR3C5]